MQIVSDFHLHSRFSRAVSPQMNLTNISLHAKQKGIALLTVSDFTHPVWLKEIRAQLVESGEGVYTLKDDASENKTQFIFSTEISCIYKQGNKLRRVHNLIFAPNIQKAEAIQKALLAKGANLTADGRPIIGLSSKALLELVLSIDESCFLIPCHIWTPHFGVYGSASGFESLDECFEDLAPYIYGIETGISSDPEMNWQISELQHRSILSFSDAHSLPKMGREATVLELSSVTYPHILSAIKRNSTENYVAYTIEFYPEEGKYHFSGHRKCGVSNGPDEIRAGNNNCPVCGRKLTEGVLYRLQELADFTKIITRKKQDKAGVLWFLDSTENHPPFVKLVPLLEIIAESFGIGVGSKKIQSEFTRLCETLGSEIEILLHLSLATIQQTAGEKIAEGIGKVRKGELVISPGFDGEYGKVTLWEENEKNVISQLSLEI
jgi:uncharacterized protein (TIGR00375 family)